MLLVPEPHPGVVAVPLAGRRPGWRRGRRGRRGRGRRRRDDNASLWADGRRQRSHGARGGPRDTGPRARHVAAAAIFVFCGIFVVVVVFVIFVVLCRSVRCAGGGGGDHTHICGGCGCCGCGCGCGCVPACGAAAVTHLARTVICPRVSISTPPHARACHRRGG